MRSFDVRRTVGLFALLALLFVLPMRAGMGLSMGNDAMAAIAGDGGAMRHSMLSCDGCGNSQMAMAGVSCMMLCAGGFVALPAAPLLPVIAEHTAPVKMPPRAGTGILIAPEPLPPRLVTLV